jgi:hypothetical protein
MGFIKNIIAGIVSFITGLFSKKGDSYYLELKEEANVTPAPAPASATATATVVPKAAPVAAKVTKAEPVKPVKIAVPTETNFATKYLIPTNNPRRRPGVNMSTFLDMARQVKTPG